MAGASAVLDAAGCSLVGGHTCEGKELSLGFAVNGHAALAAAKTKGGMRTGDVLILTKPVGTGTLFAAEMRGKAQGRWVAAALQTMLTSNGTAASVLVEHGATACTDVTGFGLAGHLVEMSQASGLQCALSLGAVPMLPGAIDLVAGGVFSSLQPSNARARHALVCDEDDLVNDPRYALLFDPQTAGGLLATVNVGVADACVAALKRAGYKDAAAIGRVTGRLGEDSVACVVGL